MTDNAKLLTKATNYAVVQLPGRQYPGVVFQGDSVYLLAESLQTILRMLGRGEVDDSIVELEDVIKNLNSILDSYERVLETESISLPYKKR